VTPPARSLFAFGLYVIIAGLGLALAPGLVLELLGFPPPGDGWVRVVGIIAVFVGMYHVIAARHELMPYIRATVPARVMFALALGVLVISKVMPPSLLLFAAVDLAGAIWTGVALDRSLSARP
jgi:hypothetical protein